MKKFEAGMLVRLTNEAAKKLHHIEDKVYEIEEVVFQGLYDICKLSGIKGFIHTSFLKANLYQKS